MAKKTAIIGPMVPESSINPPLNPYPPPCLAIAKSGCSKQPNSFEFDMLVRYDREQDVRGNSTILISEDEVNININYGTIPSTRTDDE